MSGQPVSSLERSSEITRTSQAENLNPDNDKLPGHIMEPTCSTSSESCNLSDNSHSDQAFSKVESGVDNMNLSDNSKPGVRNKVEKKDAAVQVNCKLIKIADFPAYCESEHSSGCRVQSALFLDEMGSIAKFRELSGPVLVHGDRIRKRSAMLTFSQMRDLMSQADQDVPGDATIEASDDTNRDAAKHSSRALDQIALPLNRRSDQVKELMSQAKELGILKTEATSSDAETIQDNKQNCQDYNSGVGFSPGDSLGSCIVEALRQCEKVLPKYGGHSMEEVVSDNGGKCSGKTGSSGSRRSSRGGSTYSDSTYSDNDNSSSSTLVGDSDVIVGDDDDDLIPTRIVTRKSRRVISLSSEEYIVDDDDDGDSPLEPTNIETRKSRRTISLSSDDDLPVVRTRVGTRTSRRIMSSSDEENKVDKKTNISGSHWVRRSARERIKCRHCDRMFTDQNQCRVHEAEHTPLVVTCVACSMEFPNEDELIKHAEMVHLQSPKINRVETGSGTLNSLFKSPGNHSKVLQFRSTEGMTSEKDLKQEVPSGMKRSHPDHGDVDEQFPSKRTLRTQPLPRTMLIFKCPDCDAAFWSPADLLTHKKKMHSLQSSEKGAKILTAETGQPEEDRPSTLRLEPIPKPNAPDLLSVTPKVQSSTLIVQSSASNAPKIQPVKPMMQSVQVSTNQSKVKQGGGMKCSKCSWVFFDKEKLHEHEKKVHKIANPGQNVKDVQDGGRTNEKSVTSQRKEVTGTSTGTEKRKPGRQKKVRLAFDTDTTSTSADSDLDTGAKTSSSSEKLPRSSRSKRAMKKCPHCPLSFSCQESFKNHLHRHLSGYSCSSCDCICVTERGLSMHFMRNHAGEEMITRKETSVSADQDGDEDVGSAGSSDDATYKPNRSSSWRPSLKVSTTLFQKRPHNDSPLTTGTDDSNVSNDIS